MEQDEFVFGIPSSDSGIRSQPSAPSAFPFQRSASFDIGRLGVPQPTEFALGLERASSENEAFTDATEFGIRRGASPGWHGLVGVSGMYGLGGSEVGPGPLGSVPNAQYPPTSIPRNGSS